MVFIAENIREYLSERKKESEFIKSMIADLKKDTANFSIYEFSGKVVVNNVDSLVNPFEISAKRFTNIGALFHGKNHYFQIIPLHCF